MAIISLMSNLAKLIIIREGYIKNKFLLIDAGIEEKRKKKILMADLAK